MPHYVTHAPGRSAGASRGASASGFNKSKQKPVVNYREPLCSHQELPRIEPDRVALCDFLPLDFFYGSSIAYLALFNSRWHHLLQYRTLLVHPNLQRPVVHKAISSWSFSVSPMLSIILARPSSMTRRKRRTRLGPGNKSDIACASFSLYRVSYDVTKQTELSRHRNEVVHHLSMIDDMAAHIPTMIPIQIMSDIDNGRNPTHLTKDGLERAATENQFMNGKINAIEVRSQSVIALRALDSTAFIISSSHTELFSTRLCFKLFQILQSILRPPIRVQTDSLLLSPTTLLRSMK